MTKFKYTHELEWELERGESVTDVLVPYLIDQYATGPSGTHNCPPEHYDPGCGWLFEICEYVEDNQNTAYVLTQSEIDAIHAYLTDNPPACGSWRGCCASVRIRHSQAGQSRRPSPAKY